MKIVTLLICLLIMNIAMAQNDPKWDDTHSKDWPADCQKVDVISTIDKSPQPAYFFQSKADSPRPLIISLHTWSGDFNQEDTLSWICVKGDYNYIHPNFRGVNDKPEACGSELVIQDIDDAIDYAIQHGNVDTSNMHVIGVSGGGYATLLCYMKTKHHIQSFSAWASISNLEDWYYESVGRKRKYARHIAQVTTGQHFEGDHYKFNAAEARKRSPIFMNTPVAQRENSKLYISTGIHDGYTGSVPITQSLRFFNKVVRDFDPNDQETPISTEEMLRLVERRNTDFLNPEGTRHGDILFRRQYKDKVQINIFEGGHEMLIDQALFPLKAQKVLAIGDSNGAIPHGWVTQLKQIQFNDFIHNTCISGNTIGFDNLNRAELNTLRNIDNYMSSAAKTLHGMDKIMIMLGTNDCKAVFDDSLKLVPQNMKTLIEKIKTHPAYKKYQPNIYVVSPPPYASDDELIPKYKGGSEDIAWLFPRFKKVAEEEGCTFIDVYHTLLPIWSELTIDGIHLKVSGQRLVAKSMIQAGWDDSNLQNQPVMDYFKK
ncbi:SGNH/GDSL hydrolase family protein [Sunxiuqinia indica]|uniref:SGNH/GDSL hydrolase family protein n=1 Tax=Sunxiuqinia indica TaxID=2692584 RepID=UPI001356D0DE|nr:GDSL-type esterase/lipase family protein [Sunxiuqinia indica]